MRYMPENFFSEEAPEMSLDEIDDLFCQLEPIEPPPSLIENILAAVARLPRLAYSHPQYYTETEPLSPLDAIEGLVVHGNRLQPS